MVTLGESPEDLQDNLNELYKYCDKFGLEINTAKTKVVFRRRGGLRQNERLSLNGTVLETVNDFNYLGVIIRDHLL